MGQSLATSASPNEAGHTRYLSLIERKTALRIYLIAAVAALVLWGCELYTQLIAPHDRWAQPALALLMLWLYRTLERNPDTLVATQRIAAGGLGMYFMVSTLSALFFNRQTVSPYWVANNFQWMPVVSLLLHLTFPWRWAVRLSLGMLAMVALPAIWLELATTDRAWSGVMQSLVINGVLMQITFLVSLISVDRLKHGIGLIVSGHKDGPSDARQALEMWVKDRTDELARARDAAESASRAKSRFLAVMSHELRTPLHAMLVSADLLADKGHLPADAQRDARLLHTIQTSGQHLLTLIDQVLELSRIEAGKVEAVEQPMDLHAIVQKACNAVKPMAELKGIKLLVGVPDDLPATRMGDELRLTQVLINLLANAIKFTTHGHVSLTLRRLPQADAGEDWLRMSVIDTGQGMSEADQSRVFEAFYQADSSSDRQHGGAGLGLTITQELVNLMKGKLSLKSQPGHGTRMDVDLPLPILQDTKVPPLRPQGVTHDLQGQLVLIVDDDDVSRMLATEMLLGAGARVKEIDNGPDALVYLRSHRPAAVLMDWRMPGMDGLETTRRLRQGEAGELSRDVAVIGLTANAFDEDRHSCLSAGMNNVLTKPVDRQQLLDELTRWMQQAPAWSGRAAKTSSAA
ncbi:ATP-binding protein [Aquabacterium sp. NJ1]|uniref:ATP-binding protein n=1 Tax=Aquabacterium sp. NJ1 TaxID=1538295 RepID=UPI00068F22DE|nr:ATP-binding protein [Aquabacterium sp. NJ1]